MHKGINWLNLSHNLSGSKEHRENQKKHENQQYGRKDEITKNSWHQY